jgi:hypothetical protein
MTHRSYAWLTSATQPVDPYTYSTYIRISSGGAKSEGLAAPEFLRARIILVSSKGAGSLVAHSVSRSPKRMKDCRVALCTGRNAATPTHDDSYHPNYHPLQGLRFSGRVGKDGKHPVSLDTQHGSRALWYCIA